MSIFRKTSFKMIEKIPFRRRHENRISLFTAHRIRIREGPSSSPLQHYDGGGASLCEIYPPGGREAGRGHDGTICATPNYEAGKGATIKMERAGGGRPKAREIFKGVLLVSRLSLRGPVCSLHSAPLLGVRGVPPCLPPSRIPTSRQFNHKT